MKSKMSQIKLMGYLDKFTKVNIKGVVYHYDKQSKQFKSDDGQRASLDYALTHTEEISPNWFPDVDYSMDRDCGVITTINGNTIVDIKTAAHL